METLNEKLLKVVIDALDTDPTPKDVVSDDVACSEVASTLIKKVLPDFPILPSTKDLDAKLFLDKRFKRLTTPVMGCVWISPRKTNVYGHVGIQVTSEKIASNTSFGANKGKFIGNYTPETWKKEFEIKRGLKTYWYQFIS